VGTENEQNPARVEGRPIGRRAAEKVRQTVHSIADSRSFPIRIPQSANRHFEGRPYLPEVRVSPEEYFFSLRGAVLPFGSPRLDRPDVQPEPGRNESWAMKNSFPLFCAENVNNQLEGQGNAPKKRKELIFSAVIFSAVID
jgi:hypothetical protein